MVTVLSIKPVVIETEEHNTYYPNHNRVVKYTYNLC